MANKLKVAITLYYIYLYKKDVHFKPICDMIILNDDLVYGGIKYAI